MSNKPINDASQELPVIVAMTGASGALYGLRLIEKLLELEHPFYLLLSKAALMVIQMEIGLSLSSKPKVIEDKLKAHFNYQGNCFTVFAEQDWLAPPASGSAKTKGMVIIPCTTGTLGAIASGVSHCLINRSADVCLKEKNKLIMVVRETPFSTLHLENMLKLAQAGATIMPANPGFYHDPKTILDIVDFMVARVLDHLGIEQKLLAEWGVD